MFVRGHLLGQVRCTHSPGNRRGALRYAEVGKIDHDRIMGLRIHYSESVMSNLSFPMLPGANG